MTEFARALPVVLGFEGGYVDHPNDPGGATNFGVTQATYDSWRAHAGLATQPVKHIPYGEVKQIYLKNYWLAASCDKLPWPLALVVFDAAVNHGVGRAKKLLQLALGVTDDGVIGPVTLAAAEAADPVATSETLVWRRLDLYYRLGKGKQAVFLRGWLRRMIHLRKEVVR